MRRERRLAAQAIVALQALGASRTPGLEQHPEIEPTHRIMLRWAAGQGSGLPPVEWEGDLRACYPMLDDDTNIKVDRIIQHELKPAHRNLIVMWYRTSNPREVIAKRIGLSGRSSLYPEWRAVLFYLRGRFQGVGIDC